MNLHRLICLAMLPILVATGGCTGSVLGNSSDPSAPGNASSALRGQYLNAYSWGIEYHCDGDSDFGNGTIAWEAGDFRQAVADYANASQEYDAAAAGYATMLRHASDGQEKAFATALHGCAMNMSRSADAFMEAAIALMADDQGRAEIKFSEGIALVEAGDQKLNESVAATPEWIASLASS